MYMPDIHVHTSIFNFGYTICLEINSSHIFIKGASLQSDRVRLTIMFIVLYQFGKWLQICNVYVDMLISTDTL